MFQLPEKFRLHDRTRRRITLALFVLLCMAPTAGVLAVGLWRCSPSHVEAEAARISGELDLRVTLDGVRHPRPGVVVYEGVRVADPETDQTVFACRRLEAAWRDPVSEETTATSALVLTLEAPEIEAAGLAPLARLVRRGLARRTDWATLEIRVSAAAATLRSDAGARKLTAIEGCLHPRADGALGDLRFRLADIPTVPPIRLRIGRDRTATPPLVGAELDTGGGVLPCSLLALGLPGIERLGPKSGYRGLLWVNEQHQSKTCHFIGRFAGIDLEQLAGSWLPRCMTGMAELQLETARIVDGRLEEAAGSVVAGPGLVSRALLEAAVESLGLAPGEIRPETTAASIPYEQLAVSFHIDSQGLRLRGICPHPGPATVMIDRRGRLLADGDGSRQPVPAAALVQALVPPGGMAVPAARPSDWLLRSLPLPDSVHRPE